VSPAEAVGGGALGVGLKLGVGKSLKSVCLKILFNLLATTLAVGSSGSLAKLTGGRVDGILVGKSASWVIG